MAKHGTVTPENPPVRSNLRREWSRAFTFATISLIVLTLVTLGGIHLLERQFRSTLGEAGKQDTAITSLRTAIATDDAARVTSAFAGARTVFPHGNTAAAVARAQQTWSLRRVTDTQAFLDQLDRASRAGIRDRVASDTDLERELLVGLADLFALAIVGTLILRRRLSVDVIRPLTALQYGVERLRAGEFDRRVLVARRDELGDVTHAFNCIAGDLYFSHARLSHSETHDSLTGLCNRAALHERLARSLVPNGDRDLVHESVLFIDVDDFKDINDSVGHDGGDELLVHLAARVNRCVRPGDLVARLGGDEFAIVVMEDERHTIGLDIAARVMESLREPITIDGRRLLVSVSIGVATGGPDADDPAELLRRADFAMYMAKGAGKGCHQVFDVTVHDEMLRRLALERDLATVVRSGQLRLDYQPVVDLQAGRIVGYEALVRWQHPSFGLLSPAEFIEIAEETGDIDAIGCWVLDTAARQARVWHEMIPRGEELWVSVNLSGYQLLDPKSLSAIKAILDDPSVNAANVVIEVTETALTTDLTGGITSLNSLKDRGVRIAVDDFGTGFSSLSTLASLPVDILKIDQSFVSGDGTNVPSVPMLEGIVSLAHRLDLTVIAEGIEATEQLDLLGALGCQLGQGYLLGRPAPPSEAHFGSPGSYPAAISVSAT